MDKWMDACVDGWVVINTCVYSINKHHNCLCCQHGVETQPLEKSPIGFLGPTCLHQQRCNSFVYIYVYLQLLFRLWCFQWRGQWLYWAQTSIITSRSQKTPHSPNSRKRLECVESWCVSAVLVMSELLRKKKKPKQPKTNKSAQGTNHQEKVGRLYGG